MSKSLSVRGVASFRFRNALLPACLALAGPFTAYAGTPTPGAVPAAVAEAAGPAAIRAAISGQASGELRGFYAHADRLLWIAPDGSVSPAARELVQLVRTAELDSLDPNQLGARELGEALRQAQAEREPEALARAELALSRALGDYAAAMLGQSGSSDMFYEHAVLRPIQPNAFTVLKMAAEAASLEQFVRDMRWMHPLYGQIRQKLAEGGTDPALRRAGLSTLERLRDVPAPRWQRHVVIDIASARLWMYEGDRVVDSMRVVVGKADTQTPIMAGYIRDAVLNPYWHVPDHLVRQTIAAGVLSQGQRYLRARGYQVLSDWSDDAIKLDPASVDWRAVRSGDLEVRVRQAPGAANSMGRVKYEFPNPMGIYLHDTPDKDLMQAADRHFSNGCIRLEDAERLGRWLLGGPLPQTGSDPEQKVNLPQPVPIYITYLTVQSDGGQLALASDPYGHDRGQALAHAE